MSDLDEFDQAWADLLGEDDDDNPPVAGKPSAPKVAPAPVTPSARPSVPKVPWLPRSAGVPRPEPLAKAEPTANADDVDIDANAAGVPTGVGSSGSFRIPVAPPMPARAQPTSEADDDVVEPDDDVVEPGDDVVEPDDDVVEPEDPRADEPTPSVPVAVAGRVEPRRASALPMWIPIAAAAALALAVYAMWPSGDPPTAPAVAPAVAGADAEPARAAAVERAPSPPPSQAPADPAPPDEPAPAENADDAAPGDADAPAVAGVDGAAATDGADDADTDEPDEPNAKEDDAPPSPRAAGSFTAENEAFAAAHETDRNDRTPESAEALVRAACTVSDGEIARQAFRRVRGEGRNDLLAECEAAGIDLLYKQEGYLPEEVLARAERALAAGEVELAIDLAKQRNKMKRSDRALVVQGTGYCILGKVARARKLLWHLGRDKKPELVAACKKHGHDITPAK